MFVSFLLDNIDICEDFICLMAPVFFFKLTMHSEVPLINDSKHSVFLNIFSMLNVSLL